MSCNGYTPRQNNVALRIEPGMYLRESTVWSQYVNTFGSQSKVSIRHAHPSPGAANDSVER